MGLPSHAPTCLPASLPVSYMHRKRGRGREGERPSLFSMKMGQRVDAGAKHRPNSNLPTPVCVLELPVDWAQWGDTSAAFPLLSTVGTRSSRYLTRTTLSIPLPTEPRMKVFQPFFPVVSNEVMEDPSPPLHLIYLVCFKLHRTSCHIPSCLTNLPHLIAAHHMWPSPAIRVLGAVGRS